MYTFWWSLEDLPLLWPSGHVAEKLGWGHDKEWDGLVGLGRHWDLGVVMAWFWGQSRAAVHCLHGPATSVGLMGRGAQGADCGLAPAPTPRCQCRKTLALDPPAQPSTRPMQLAAGLYRALTVTGQVGPGQSPGSMVWHCYGPAHHSNFSFSLYFEFV